MIIINRRTIGGHAWRQYVICRGGLRHARRASKREVEMPFRERHSLIEKAPLKYYQRLSIAH